MFKHRWLSLGLTAAIAISGIPELSTLAQNNSGDGAIKAELDMFAKKPGGRYNSDDGEIKVELSTLRQMFAKKKGGRRGDGVCALSPATGVLPETFVVWSDRPIFLWKTDVNQIAVQSIQLLLADTREIIWDKTLTATEQADQSVAYDGKALQPGQLYRWRLKYIDRRTNPQNEGQTPLTSFQVMKVDQRNQVATELKTRTQQLQASGKSPEVITIRQATYFAEQGLLSDALQVVYAIENPSAETTKTVQALIDSACSEESGSTGGGKSP